MELASFGVFVRIRVARGDLPRVLYRDRDYSPFPRYPGAAPRHDLSEPRDKRVGLLEAVKAFPGLQECLLRCVFGQLEGAEAHERVPDRHVLITTYDLAKRL